MPTVVQLPKVPAEMWAAGAMDAADSVDVFAVDTPRAADTPAEEWARAALEQGAGAAGQVLWRGVLGLRLHRTAESVGGWAIVARGERWIRLEASSWFMTAHVVVYVYDERLVVATLVRYDRLLGGIVWPLAAILHRRAVPVLLRGAVKQLSVWPVAHIRGGESR